MEQIVNVISFPTSTLNEPIENSSRVSFIIGKKSDKYPANDVMMATLLAQFATQYPHTILKPAIFFFFGVENKAYA
ncbi:Uncharacterised protein [Streptococcus pneumoniae]|nr:Uncharacterised protein [Streptococcus pneumoniae]CJC59840.1 Uncharacterised protein [Streptococcus pneumoniae]CJJ36003.1 Uncharacterised protein [Streptococcus pneumoniae]COQ52445.1 Uncharacterised protein [Streptococcus pneumoniae]